MKCMTAHKTKGPNTKIITILNPSLIGTSVNKVCRVEANAALGEGGGEMPVDKAQRTRPFVILPSRKSDRCM